MAKHSVISKNLQYEIRHVLAWSDTGFSREFGIYSSGCLDAPVCMPAGSLSRRDGYSDGSSAAEVEFTNRADLPIIND